MTLRYATGKMKVRSPAVGANDEGHAPSDFLASRDWMIGPEGHVSGSALDTGRASDEVLGCAVRSEHGSRKRHVRAGPGVPADMIDSDVRVSENHERHKARLPINPKRPELPAHERSKGGGSRRCGPARATRSIGKRNDERGRCDGNGNDRQRSLSSATRLATHTRILLDPARRIECRSAVMALARHGSVLTACRWITDEPSAVR